VGAPSGPARRINRFKRSCGRRPSTTLRRRLPDFDVPKQTIGSRIQAGKVEVWHVRVSSPVLAAEVILKSFVITAQGLCCPLSVSDCIALMDSLIAGTEYEERVIKWKMDRGMYDEEDTERESTFTKMYNQVEAGALKSGNAIKYEQPVHMDKDGNIVLEAKDAFGLPVTIKITRPENCFCFDETGDNTHGKDDGHKGGQKMVATKGEIPRELVGIKNSHFTVLPISDFTGKLQFVTLIFAAEKLKAAWAISINVFSELVEEHLDFEDSTRSFGPGKRYPGLLLFNADGNEIPVLFAATPKASMTSGILMQTFQKMDELNITQRGIGEDGKSYYPLVVIDGHMSRIREDFLCYVNDNEHLWQTMLGAPYGTDI